MQALLKKETLLKLFEENKINSCTIIGVPTKELQDYYFNDKNLLELFDKYQIENPMDEYHNTPIAVWFPKLGFKQCKELCVINVDKKITRKELDRITKKFFIEVIDYYQTNISPFIILKIIGLSEEKLNFDDMLLLMKDKQTEIARKIGKSKQLITDIKNGKTKISLDVLSKLIKEYPLLPWFQYIEQMNK